MYTVLLCCLLILSVRTEARAGQQATLNMLESNVISGLIPDIDDTYGVVLRDLNGDRYPDIYLVCLRSLNRLLINNGGIIPFIDRTIYSGLGGNLMPRGRTNLELGGSSADYDNDGKPDLFLAGWAKTHKLFRNAGNVRFEDRTGSLNMQGIADANQGIWLDADRDGFLDLFIADEHHSNRFFINKRNGYFEEALWTTGFVDSLSSQGACTADFNLDGWPDLYVTNRNGPDYLLLNNRQGSFIRTRQDLPTLTTAIRTTSASAADLDNDGDMDLMIATADRRVYYYRATGVGDAFRFEEFSDFPFSFIDAEVSGILIEDFDHDGWLDAFLTISGPNRLYLNDGRGSFLEVYDTDRKDVVSSGAAAADFDEDGDLDLVVANRTDISQIYLNPVNNYAALDIRLVGVRSNRDAAGSKVFFYTHDDSLPHLLGLREISLQKGFLSSTEPAVHFGMADLRSVDVKIIFPSGKELTRQNLLPGRRYVFSEYNRLLSMLIFSYNSIRFHAGQPAFWISTLLMLVLFLQIYLYTRIGLRRYKWQTANISTQMIIWFAFSLVIFIMLRSSEMRTILYTINGTSVFGIAISLIYSEHQLGLRRRRGRFRNRLQSLSDQILTIHENSALFRELLSAIQQHDQIKSVILLIYENGCLVSAQDRHKKSELNEAQQREMLSGKIIYSGQSSLLAELFKTWALSVLLPVKRGRALLAVIGINMVHFRKPLNREDLQLILPIANQMAIAIENNRYIQETRQLVQELTEARLREKYLKQLEETNRQLDQKNAELMRLFTELQQKESQLIQSEKMASLGQLVAGISHELNNPISFIYANNQALRDYLNELKHLWQSLPIQDEKPWQQKFDHIYSELEAIIRDNINGSRSVKELVLNLKNFSRLDQADWKEVHLSEGLESSLKILRNELKDKVELVKEYRDDPLIYCSPGQINQVFINLLSNAIQAIDKRGRISIKMECREDHLHIAIHDNGRGIEQENLSKIFDPFFTTKDVNKGTGLGLSISYSIIQKHGGIIRVESAVGQGSTFTIVLPLSNKREPRKSGREQ